MKSVRIIGVRDGRSTLSQNSGQVLPDILLEVEPRKRPNSLKKDGHKRETICPQIKWGNAIHLVDDHQEHSVEVKIQAAGG